VEGAAAFETLTVPVVSSSASATVAVPLEELPPPLNGDWIALPVAIYSTSFPIIAIGTSIASPVSVT